MRSLGEFFGHVWKGVKTDAAPRREPAPPHVPRGEVVRREVQETTVETPRGPVILRRTTVDEIEPPRRA